MSDARSALMGKIQATIDGHAINIDPAMVDDDVELDQAADVQSNTELIDQQRLEQARLRTETIQHGLEEAKRKASSQAVKDELATEIATIKAEKIKAEQEKEEPTLASGIGGIAQGIGDRARYSANRVIDTGRDVWDGFSRVATPGTIFLPVAILLIFWLLLLPVNGHTRIEWLWLALTGNAHIKGENANNIGDFNTPSIPVNPAIVGSGASGNFGASYSGGYSFTGPSVEL